MKSLVCILIFLISAVASATEYISIVDGNAFYYNSDLDLSAYQTGEYRLIVEDSGGKTATGIISATPPAGETLGADLISGWDFTSGWTPLNASIVDANTFSPTINYGGVYRSFVGLSAVTGAVYKANLVATADTRMNNATGPISIVVAGSVDYYTHTGLGNLIVLHPTSGTTVDVTSMSLERVTDPPSTGARITDGTGQNWESVESGFNPNVSFSESIFGPVTIGTPGGSFSIGAP